MKAALFGCLALLASTHIAAADKHTLDDAYPSFEEDPKAIVKANDFVRVVQYDGMHKSAVMKAAGSIVRITGIAAQSCTGALVTADTILTNAHCWTETDCFTAEFEFYALNERMDLNRSANAFRCAATLGKNGDLDASLIQLTEIPENFDSRFRPLSFAADRAPIGAPLMILQHPGGDPMTLSLKDCAYTSHSSPARDTRRHSCDTKGGSSGSPVLSLDGLIVGLHYGGHRLDPNDPSAANFATDGPIVRNWARQIVPIEVVDRP